MYITPQQHELFLLLQKYNNERYPKNNLFFRVSLQELADVLGKSKSHISKVMDELIQMGAIERSDSGGTIPAAYRLRILDLNVLYYQE